MKLTAFLFLALVALTSSAPQIFKPFQPFTYKAPARVIPSYPVSAVSGQYVHDNSGAYNNDDGRYHPDDSGAYHPDGSGGYKHSDAGYKHQDGPYGSNYGGSGGSGGSGGGSGYYGQGISSGQGTGTGGSALGSYGSSQGISGLKTGNAAGLYDNRNYAIIRKVEQVEQDGYHYLYETENGIFGEEEGHLQNKGSKEEAMKAKGFFSYTGPDSIVYTVEYTADENGFNPTGAHLPKPPAIPIAILRSLEYQRSVGVLKD